MPKHKLNREFHELGLREIYIHRAVGRGLARVFFTEFDQKEKEAEGGEVEFRFVDVVYFFAVAAAQGVLGNLAYDTLKAIVRTIRRPTQEFGSAKFEAVISRGTYNRLRRAKHPGTKAGRGSTIVEKKLGTEYKLMVTLERPKR